MALVRRKFTAPLWLISKTREQAKKGKKKSPSTTGSIFFVEHAIRLGRYSMVHDGAVVVADNIDTKILGFHLISCFFALNEIHSRSDLHS